MLDEQRASMQKVMEIWTSAESVGWIPVCGADEPMGEIGWADDDDDDEDGVPCLFGDDEDDDDVPGCLWSVAGKNTSKFEAAG